MAREGKVVGCHTFEAWNDELCRGNEAKRLMVVDFTASWCGPCRLMAPFFAELARKLPSVMFLRVDVDELPSVAADWGVEGMPTFMFLKEGRILGTVVGAKKDELQQLLAKHMMNTTTTTTAPSSLKIMHSYY
ncbi:thioredoxin H1-like [Ipomoea triloba]|uniref:thioredoxin H1-like n=1 Tax=Ipomoea triloba TaxID=35885 RepID=UPI00125E0F5C|nr:thioredoxin H1-like [Ipomoea triloba]GLL19188.1 thioredoxin H1-like [Ipomoea trifida]